MQVEAPTRRRAARRLMAYEDIMPEGEFSVNPHDHGASRTLMALWPTETPPAQNVSAYWTALLAELEEKILVWDHAGVNQLVAASARPPLHNTDWSHNLSILNRIVVREKKQDTPPPEPDDMVHLRWQCPWRWRCAPRATRRRPRGAWPRYTLNPQPSTLNPKP